MTTLNYILLGAAIGFVGFHLVYFLVFVIMWWRLILREKQEPGTQTEVDRIHREIGTLTYSRRN